MIGIAAVQALRDTHAACRVCSSMQALLQWLDHYTSGPGAFWTDEVPMALLFAALGLLPYVALTVVRWIATGRWRFGPRL
jgi:hypothetical protein